MKNEKEKNDRTSHFWGLRKGQSLAVTHLSGPEAEGIPLMGFL